QADSEQARLAGRRAGEREIEIMTAALKEQTADTERRQLRLDERERLAAEEAERLAERDRRITFAEPALTEGHTAVPAPEASVATAEEQHRRELERIAGLTAESARVELVDSIEAQAKREAALLVRDIENDARSTAEERARHVVVDAIQRV